MLESISLLFEVKVILFIRIYYGYPKYIKISVFWNINQDLLQKAK